MNEMTKVEVVQKKSLDLSQGRPSETLAMVHKKIVELQTGTAELVAQRFDNSGEVENPFNKDSIELTLKDGKLYAGEISIRVDRIRGSIEEWFKSISDSEKQKEATIEGNEKPLKSIEATCGDYIGTLPAIVSAGGRIERHSRWIHVGGRKRQAVIHSINGFQKGNICKLELYSDTMEVGGTVMKFDGVKVEIADVKDIFPE